MKNWKLYVILDKALLGNKDLKGLTEAVIDGGADAVQLRNKISSSRTFINDAWLVRNITKNFGVSFIVNDRVDIASIVGADGVHLGQDDLSIDNARFILGVSALVGKSCHSLEQAIRAQAEGVDYIGWGPIFKTSTKPQDKPIGINSIKELKKHLQIPVVCIGGINNSNVEELIVAGIHTVAIASAIVTSSDPRIATSAIKKVLEAKKYDPVRICSK